MLDQNETPPAALGAPPAARSPEWFAGRRCFVRRPESGVALVMPWRLTQFLMTPHAAVPRQLEHLLSGCSWPSWSEAALPSLHGTTTTTRSWRYASGSGACALSAVAS